MKKIITIMMILCMSFCLTACESDELKKAKECIDKIYEYTSDMAEAEVQIAKLSSKSELSIEEDALLLRYETEYENYQKHIESKTELLESYYGKLSDKEKDVIAEYTEEVLDYYIENIFAE